MSKTYTFPQLNLVSGTFDITIKTSRGSGSTSVSEKYFSSINPLVKETEVFGGSLRHDSVSFSIEHDKDNYFRDTILASFQDADGWVDILVQSNGVYEFYGTIDPTTVSAQRFYVDGDIHESISFDAHWIIRRLEKSKIEDLEDLFDTVDCFTGQQVIRTIVLGVPVYSVSDYAYLFRITYVMDKIFELLKTITGLTTVNVAYDSLAYGAVSKDCFVATTTDVVPDVNNNNAGVSAFIGDKDYVAFEDFLLFWKYTNGTKTNTLWDTSDDAPDLSFYNRDNVYEVLVDILKSFGFVLTIDSVTATELNVTIKDRVNGENKDGVVDQLTESERMLLTTEYLEAITTTPKANNVNQPPYEYFLKANYGSSFSYTTAFKTKGAFTGGDTDYKNYLCAIGTYTVNGVSANIPFGLLDIVSGNRLNSNWDFPDQIGGVPTGWTGGTTGSASIATADHTVDNHTPNTTTSGCVLFTLTADNEAAYLQCDVGSVDYEMLIPMWIKFPSTSGISSSTTITYAVSIYDSSNTLLVPENSISEYEKGWTLSSINSIGATNWRMMTFRIRPKRGEVVKYVRITAVVQLPSGSFTMRLDDISIWRSYQYFHQVLGRKLKEYYTRPNSKLKNRYSGIYAVNCGDNISDNGIIYYVKKVAKDFQNNETEIEAINYQ